MEIQFQDPPPANAGRPRDSKFQAFCDELRKHPTRWALYGRYSAPLATRFNKLEGFKATTRSVPSTDPTAPKLVDIYVKYEPPVDEPLVEAPKELGS
jgi:hypothetical protein